MTTPSFSLTAMPLSTLTYFQNCFPSTPSLLNLQMWLVAKVTQALPPISKPGHSKWMVGSCRSQSPPLSVCLWQDVRASHKSLTGLMILCGGCCHHTMFGRAWDLDSNLDVMMVLGLRDCSDSVPAIRLLCHLSHHFGEPLVIDW